MDLQLSCLCLMIAGGMSDLEALTVAGKSAKAADDSANNKHTLESDEEDGGDQYDKLDEDDIEGNFISSLNVCILSQRTFES